MKRKARRDLDDSIEVRERVEDDRIQGCGTRSNFHAANSKESPMIADPRQRDSSSNPRDSREVAFVRSSASRIVSEMRLPHASFHFREWESARGKLAENLAKVSPPPRSPRRVSPSSSVLFSIDLTVLALFLFRAEMIFDRGDLGESSPAREFAPLRYAAESKRPADCGEKTESSIQKNRTRES